eukprot:1499903-Amphidinium_carterae.1
MVDDFKDCDGGAREELDIIEFRRCAACCVLGGHVQRACASDAEVAADAILRIQITIVRCANRRGPQKCFPHPA